MQTVHISLDSHKIVKHLMSKGFSEDQAEGFIQAIEEISFHNVATKEDIRRLEEDIRRLESTTREEVQRLKETFNTEFQRVDASMAGLGKEMYRIMAIQIIGIVGLTVTLIKFLPQL